MRAGRLISIVLLLQLRARLTADELAAECEVSVRTIYRDIEELSRAGVPVYADRGPGGGFQLVDGYRTRLTGLGADEAEAVFMIGMPAAADAVGLGDAAASAGRKLLASLPKALSDGAGRLGSRFHLDPVDWYRDAAPPSSLPALARAILDQRVIELTYESWTTTRDWQLEPLGMVLKAGNWYLVAQHQDRRRIYKVASIRQLQVLETTFDRPDDFDLAAFWSAETARFEAGLRPATALVRTSALGRTRMSAWGSYARRAVSAASAPDADGWALVELPIETLEQAALLLLGAGPEFEVIEPAELRTRVGSLATGIAEMQRPPADPKT